MTEGYATAIRLIEAARRDDATTLELTNLDLESLPETLAGLTGLTTLHLGGNRLTRLPDWLRRLTGLTRLSLYVNQLTALPDWLGDLTRLTRLSLGGNQLKSLPDSLGRLTRLTTLSLYDNQLTTLPDSLGDLVNLTSLSLSGNQLSALPESLGGLVNLVELDLGFNRLRTLPESLGALTRLETFVLEGNDLVSPPKEICASGTVAVLAFLRALARGGEEQWSSKMLVVGEAAVGKTTVTKALCGLAYDPSEPQTHGVHVDPLDLRHPEHPDVSMRLNLWDFGGQLEYRATQRFYLTDRSLFLLVWNSRRGWRVGGQVEEWLQAITNVAPSSPIVIVATHCTESVADLDEADLRRRYPRITNILRVDCQDGTGIAELREEIRRRAADLPLMGRRWPATWAGGARRLAAEPGRYITTHRAELLMAEAGMDDPVERRALLNALHDRGQILHFANDPELRYTVVLEPTWVDALITRVLDSQEVVDRGGLLSRAHRAELWRDLDDPGLGETLTALMERFDLAYRTDAPGQDDVALVVERLPAGAPAELPVTWRQALDVPGATELRITYKLSSRQAGIPSWFIAREHRFTTGVAWARGVLLRHHHGPGHAAMALLEDDDRAQPTIRLTVRGVEPHAFYSILHEGFTGILAERYPGLGVQQLIPCVCDGAPGPPCSYEFDHSAALRALERGVGLQCQQSLSTVDPRTLLLGLRPVPLERTLAEIQRDLGQLAETAGRIEVSQLHVLDTVRDLLRHRAEQGVRCPSIFTVTRTGFLRYELRLYCEQPEAPHPLPDDAGVYELRRIPDWLRAYAPYLRLLLSGLRFALPLVGPALTGLAGVALSAADEGRLELSCRLLDRLAGPPQDQTDGLLDPAHASRPRTSADFARLRQALLALDPSGEWGGLRERELPENRGVAYLCHQHREALRYPARTPLEPPAPGAESGGPGG
ncbi:COR domain-containing protein [Nonomuraea pusilla]|uniref:leucine-rich repeat domain-containing protein n=1 Tax=Nonomuraea pusilla TaxID=46177 RepID=UPI00332E8CE6